MTTSDANRYAVARAFATQRGLVLKGPEGDFYALVDAATLQPVVGREDEGFLVQIDEIETYLGI
ncbi:hypothetical protein [Microbacterium sp. P02]|uniref:hypothetical protein n=1 Tax=Microbacterium sp. P02 TaxID=3366260 RepID=UPI00366B51D8